jgi:hypothetical protein
MPVKVDKKLKSAPRNIIAHFYSVLSTFYTTFKTLTNYCHERQLTCRLSQRERPDKNRFHDLVIYQLLTIVESRRDIPYGPINLQKFAHFHWLNPKCFGFNQ